ncbi:MAG: MlaD family protein, partial [Candidatus Helarchaeales archaeon]
VKVDLSLYQKYEDQFRKSSRIAVVTEGVLGEKIVEITVRPGLYHEDLTRLIIGEDPLEAQDLAEAFENSAEALLETSDGISDMMIEVQELAISIRRLLNRIEQRVIDGNLFKVF